MKTAALLLCGSLRKESNISRVKNFINFHNNINVKVFIITYDRIGFGFSGKDKSKKFDFVKNKCLKSELLEKDIFKRLNPINLKFVNYENIYKIVEKYYNENIGNLINKKNIDEIYKDKNRNINLMMQCYMINLNLKEVKNYLDNSNEKIDFIIKSRFDMNQNYDIKTQISKIDKNTIYAKYTQTPDYYIINDRYYYFDIDLLKKMIDIYAIEYWKFFLLNNEFYSLNLNLNGHEGFLMLVFKFLKLNLVQMT